MGAGRSESESVETVNSESAEAGSWELRTGSAYSIGVGNWQLRVRVDRRWKLATRSQYCMIGLCHLMAGDDSRMAGGESRMTGDCCRPEGSIHRCVRTHSHLYSYIYGLVALF